MSIVRRGDPHTVYVLFAEGPRALYVGVSVDPLSRLNVHSKEAWWSDVIAVTFESQPNRREALNRERWLIEQMHPEHNKRHRIPVPPMLPDGAAA